MLYSCQSIYDAFGPALLAGWLLDANPTEPWDSGASFPDRSSVRHAERATLTARNGLRTMTDTAA